MVTIENDIIEIKCEILTQTQALTQLSLSTFTLMLIKTNFLPNCDINLNLVHRGFKIVLKAPSLW